ncbi:hypothetical protein LXL04_017669 [Taraxacum kok-saghyz]
MELGDGEERWNQKKVTPIDEISHRLIDGDLYTKIQAAMDIRSMIRNRNSPEKIRAKFATAGVIPPLVLMLCSQHHDAREASLLALLNLASRNERNKEHIVKCGAISPLVKLLKFQNTSRIRELATAAILTLSATQRNKPAIAASAAIPLLIQILSSRSDQERVDAVTTLHNLSTSNQEPAIVLEANAAPPLLDLLKECKKYSKCADKTTALIEIISKSPEGRLAITNSEDGILTLVETVEDGSLVSKEHAVGALLTLCLSSTSKYRELILNEGAIPGLLRLTVDGTKEGRDKARTLLKLLREAPPEKQLSSSGLEKMVQDIGGEVDGGLRKTTETEKIVQEVVQRSMSRA